MNKIYWGVSSNKYGKYNRFTHQIKQNSFITWNCGKQCWVKSHISEVSPKCEQVRQILNINFESKVVFDISKIINVENFYNNYSFKDTQKPSDLINLNLEK